jgi:glycine cleavage system H protein
MFFSNSHEWVKIEEDIATIGISFFAQKELGDIVYIQLPKVGDELTARKECVVVESTKAATDIYSPVSGEVIEVNQNLKANLSILNEDPENAGWMVKVRLFDKSEVKELMTSTDYLELIRG